MGKSNCSTFPGMLLRYFVNFYDMEIIEEEAFLLWKEDITQEYPGKGKALFQVILYPSQTNIMLYSILFQIVFQPCVSDLSVYLYN